MIQRLVGCTLAACLLTACAGQRTPAGSQTVVDLVVEGDWVVTMRRPAGDSPAAQAPEVLRPGAVVIDDGRIVAIGTPDAMRARYTAQERLDGAGRAVMPGLVNGHTHAAMSLLRGVADDLELIEWLEKYIFPAEVALVDADFVRVGTELACREMIRGGTTAFVDMYYFPDTVAETVVRCGLRAVVAPTVIDQKSPDAADGAESLAVASGFAARWKDRHDRVTPCIGAHAVYTLSPDWLTRVRDAAAAAQVPTCIHLSESQFEVAYARQQFDATSTELLDRLDFFKNPTIAAHVVWPTDGDIATLAKRRVGAIHNPTSNMKLSSGIAPYPKLLAAGVPVGLGTDGAASNNDLDLWEEMRLAAFLHKVDTMDPTAMPAGRVLEMATWRGAEAIGLGEKIGRLERGMRADLIRVDVDELSLQPIYDIVSHLVYVSDEHDVTDVIVDGRVLMRDRFMLTIDEAQLRRDVDTWAQRIRDTVGH